MAIEIFGFPVNLEIGIGDTLGASIATIGLIASAVIFSIGYEATSQDDLFNSFRLSLMFWH
jgi:hypothetical protein